MTTDREIELYRTPLIQAVTEVTQDWCHKMTPEEIAGVFRIITEWSSLVAHSAQKEADVYTAADLIIAALTIRQVHYASSHERGEHRGFAALHDLMDANMLLPQWARDEVCEGNLENANAITAEVDAFIRAFNGGGGTL